MAGLASSLTASKDNMQAGEKLYQKSAAPVACAECHGEPAYDKLSDAQIWQLTMYLRSFEIRTEPINGGAKKSKTEQVAL